MIVVAGHVTLKPGMREKTIEASRAVIEPTRREPGCLSYSFYFDILDPEEVHVFEEWETEAHLDAHLETPHVQAFFAVLPDLIAGPPDVKRYLVSEVKPL